MRRGLFAIIGLSMPDFWLATMLLLALTLWIGWLPEFGYFPLWEDPSRNLQALIFPAVNRRLPALRHGLAHDAIGDARSCCARTTCAPRARRGFRNAPL